MPPPDPIEKLRLSLVERVRGVFNDTAAGQQPVPVSDDALFERDSPIRLVHACLPGQSLVSVFPEKGEGRKLLQGGSFDFVEQVPAVDPDHGQDQ